MRVLILGLNYTPEPVGIGPYTSGLAEWLAARGHRVTVVCGKPYYPAWAVAAGHRAPGYRRSRVNGVGVIRCPIYVPARPTGGRRIIHHLGFAIAAAPALATCVRDRPDVIMSVAPSLLSAPVARLVARWAGVPHWLHLQDFELEAALATGLLRPGIARLAARVERWSLRADMVSAISAPMCTRLRARGIAPERVVELRNWASLERVRPLEGSDYRAHWAIDRPHVLLYSGSLAAKQGLGLVVAAARRLAHRRDILFLICGDGPHAGALRRAAAGLDNLRLEPLQPAERLGELLALATVHLLPQIGAAADLVLPSKLTNMLASGRPVVATAPPGTGLAAEVDGCGVVVPPDDPAALAAAVVRLVDDPAACRVLGAAARDRAEARWNRQRILERFEQQLAACVARGADQAGWGRGARHKPSMSGNPEARN